MIILKGRPITKKNSQIPVFTTSGKRFIIQSKQYRAYEKSCLEQIVGKFDGLGSNKIHLQALYYMPDKRMPDLLNLLAATSDIIEKAGIIDDDKNIISFDGSRIMGVDKENPRVEIFIETIRGD